MTDPTTDIDDAMARIREVVGVSSWASSGRCRRTSTPPRCRASAAICPPSSTPERRAELVAEAERLDPWLQGPFWLGGDLVIGGAWRNDDALGQGFGKEVPADLSGKRVLDVGSNAGYDPFMFHLRGAEYVLGAEPFMFIEQARFLERIYKTGIDFQPLGWQDLDPGRARARSTSCTATACCTTTCTRWRCCSACARCSRRAARCTSAR